MTNLIQLQTALNFESLGWSVIPVPLKSKAPIIKWEEYQTTRPNKDQLSSWFSGEDLNMALVTGKVSGIVVVDVDPRNGGNIGIVQSPLMVKTGGGGVHGYYKYSPEISECHPRPGVDIKARGIVILPPSVHPSGALYEWITPPTEDIIKNLPEVPKSLLPKIEVTKPNLSDSLNANQGDRNNKLYTASIRTLNLLNKDDRASAGWKMILSINDSYNPPLPENEVKTIFNSALRFVTNNPPAKQITKGTKIDWKPTTTAEELDLLKNVFKTGLPQGIPTGFNSLDKITNGLIPGQTYLFFGDTNTGKSAFVINILSRLAKRGEKVCYFDLENSWTETATRLCLISDSELNLENWRKAISEKNVDKYLDKLKQLPFTIWELTKLNDRFGAITFDGIENVIREEVAKGIRIFALDHIHYFEPSEVNYSYLGECARILNNLSATLGIVILIVAHTKKGLVQGIDSNNDKPGQVAVRRPTIDSISGSSLISKHTKNTIGIMRNYMSDDPQGIKKTWIFVDKTKSGPSGKFTLEFDPNTLTFIDEYDYK